MRIEMTANEWLQVVQILLLASLSVLLYQAKRHGGRFTVPQLTSMAVGLMALALSEALEWTLQRCR